MAYCERSSGHVDDAEGTDIAGTRKAPDAVPAVDPALSAGAMNQPATDPAVAPAAGEPVYSLQAVHLVRTVTTANISLSQMADQKASIMMGATFVVFTISIGQASRGPFPLSLAILASFAFLSAVFAMAAILPAVSPRKGAQLGTNILFFGVFAQMSEEEFTERVLHQLTTDEGLFRTMLRDIYQNGLVLHRKKYRFLGYAYWTFLIGLTATFVTFLLERSGVLPVAGLIWRG
jgi:hypothetical protein